MNERNNVKEDPNIHRKRLFHVFQFPRHEKFGWHIRDRRNHLRIDIQRWLNLLSGDQSISFDWLGCPAVNAFAYCEPQKTFSCIGISIGAYLRTNLIFYSLLAYTDIFDQHFQIGERDKNINHDMNLPRIIAMTHDELQENIPVVFSNRWWVASMLEDRMTEFLFAHELAHIVLGHVTRVQKNRLNKMWSSLQQKEVNQQIGLEERWVMELNADRLATDIVFLTHFKNNLFLGEASLFSGRMQKKRDDFFFCFLTAVEVLMHSIHVQRKQQWGPLEPHPISGYPTPWIRYHIVLNRCFFWMQRLFGLKVDHIINHNLAPTWIKLQSIRKAFHLTDDKNFLSVEVGDIKGFTDFNLDKKIQQYSALWEKPPLFERLLQFLTFPKFDLYSKITTPS